MTSDTSICKQKTIEKEVSLTGVGLFTGTNVSLTLKPAKENCGIIFQRTDLAESPTIPAKLSFVKETPRCTILGNDRASIWTVEHLLSALNAYEIDNVLVEVHGPEIPVCDGSSKTFVEMIEQGGVVEQDAEKKIIILSKPIYWSQKEVHIVALPSSDFRISYLLHYPKTEMLKSQYYTTVVDPYIYKEEICPCRTFSVYEEIEPLLKKGVIRVGGLNNADINKILSPGGIGSSEEISHYKILDLAVVIKDNKVLNPEGIRFPEEMARHKILDLIGDLSLLGGKIFGHIIAIRSGHFSNISFARKILKLLETEERR